MMKKRTLFFRSPWITRLQKPFAVLAAFGMTAMPVLAQPPIPRPDARADEAAASPRRSGEKELQLNFRDSPIDQVLDLIADLTGRTIIKSPGVNATITLKSQTRLKVSESLQAIEAVLAMHNITLVPMGEKFLKAVQTAQARQEGMPINVALPETLFSETDKLISQVFTLQHLEIAEIQPIIQSLLHGYGKIQPLERANSLMITDTESNLARVTEILDLLDQPIEQRVETRIYEIRYAEAAQVASKLNELIADSQAEEDKEQINVQPAQPNIPAPPGVIRARQARQQAEQSGPTVESAAQLAERGVIRGKVKIIADERTSILFVISRTENFVFFDKIVNVLDRPVEPAITVRVVALEYAKADEIAGILNEFIGAAAAEEDAGGRPSDSGGENTPGDNRSQALRDFIRQRTEQRAAAAADAGEKGEGAIGRLSSDTKILADQRTNSLLMMGKLEDLMILEDLVDNLDIMLAQVVIEAVIIEVSLSDDIQSGVDWLQRSMVAYNESMAGPGGGVTLSDPVAAWGGGTSFGAGDPIDGSTVDRSTSIASGGMSWFVTLFDLNVDAVFRLAALSRDAQVLSTPVIVTTDNTEAKINASTQRPVVTTTSTTDGGSIRSSYEYRDIGINLTVTPRINPQRMVVMEITQTADDVAGEILIDGNLVPEITKRELTATVAVGDRETIVLGGLVLNRNSESETKVPLLGDIPIIGRLFKFKSDTKQRNELIVLLTPYVLMTPTEARAESTRLYSATSVRQKEWPTGWSDSEMSRMSDKARKEYIENWDENRPEPYVRDLSYDLFEEDEVNAEAVGTEGSGKKTLMGMLQDTENPEEAIEFEEEIVVEEAAPAEVEQPAVDYSKPLPVK